MKIMFLLLLPITLFFGLFNAQRINITCQDAPLNTYTYCNPNAAMTDRVNDLLSRMTIMEKVTMYNSDNYGIPRLGVLPLGHCECNRGTSVRPNYRNSPEWPTTTFPQASLLGGSFSRDIVSGMARAISNEVRAKYNKALAENQFVTNGFGISCWGPMLNICRDPRWYVCTYIFMTCIPPTNILNIYIGDDVKKVMAKIQC